MATLHEILSKEATNASAIYLYKRGDRWFAYEHSAYHFTLVFRMGEIVCAGDQVCVVVNNHFEFLNSKAMCSVQITSVADTEVKIDCVTAFAGFEQWKKSN